MAVGFMAQDDPMSGMASSAALFCVSPIRRVRIDAISHIRQVVRVDSHRFLQTAVIFLLATVIAVPLTKRFRLGAVLGYLLAGIVIGPAELGLVINPAGVSAISEFGVVLMVGGNLPGITRTVSIAIFDDVQSLDYHAAMHTSLLLMGISFLVLAATYGLRRRVWDVWPGYGQ